MSQTSTPAQRIEACKACQVYLQRAARHCDEATKDNPELRYVLDSLIDAISSLKQYLEQNPAEQPGHAVDRFKATRIGD